MASCSARRLGLVAAIGLMALACAPPVVYRHPRPALPELGLLINGRLLTGGTIRQLGSWEQQTIRLGVVARRDPRNRRWTLSLHGDDDIAIWRQDRQVDGVEAPSIWPEALVTLPRGRYFVTLALERTTGETRRVQIALLLGVADDELAEPLCPIPPCRVPPP